MLAAVAAEDHRKEYSIRPRQLLDRFWCLYFALLLLPLYSLFFVWGVRVFVCVPA